MKFFFGELYKILLEIASALVKFLARFCLDFGNRNRITPWFKEFRSCRLIKLK